MSSETIPTIKSLIFTFPKTAVDLKLCCYCPQSLLLTSRTVRWKMLPLDFLLLLHHGRILQHILWLSVFVFLGGLRFTICMKMVDLFVVHLGNWRMNLYGIFAFFFELLIVWNVNCTAAFCSDAIVSFVLLNRKMHKTTYHTFIFFGFHGYWDTTWHFLMSFFTVQTGSQWRIEPFLACSGSFINVKSSQRELWNFKIEVGPKVGKAAVMMMKLLKCGLIKCTGKLQKQILLFYTHSERCF